MITPMRTSEITTTTTRTSSSSSSSGQTAQNEVNEWLCVLEKRYREYLGTNMPQYISAQLKQDMKTKGEVMYWYCLYALQQAAAAPHPSWAYARAILRRLIKEQVDVDEIVWALMNNAY